jgi:hypothetical protein
MLAIAFEQFICPTRIVTRAVPAGTCQMMLRCPPAVETVGYSVPSLGGLMNAKKRDAAHLSSMWSGGFHLAKAGGNRVYILHSGAVNYSFQRRGKVVR